MGREEFQCLLCVPKFLVVQPNLMITESQVVAAWQHHSGAGDGAALRPGQAHSQGLESGQQQKT